MRTWAFRIERSAVRPPEWACLGYAEMPFDPAWSARDVAEEVVRKSRNSHWESAGLAVAVWRRGEGDARQPTATGPCPDDAEVFVFDPGSAKATAADNAQKKSSLSGRVDAMDSYASCRARMMSYLTTAGLSTARANANLDAFLASIPPPTPLVKDSMKPQDVPHHLVMAGVRAAGAFSADSVRSVLSAVLPLIDAGASDAGHDDAREAAHEAAVAKLHSTYSGQVPDYVAREIADAVLGVLSRTGESGASVVAGQRTDATGAAGKR